MARIYNEFSFNDDIELMNLTYKMNTGNFTNYEEDVQDEKENDKLLNNELPKFEL